jgi:hypothetical protein
MDVYITSNYEQINEEIFNTSNQPNSFNEGTWFARESSGFNIESKNGVYSIIKGSNEPAIADMKALTINEIQDYIEDRLKFNPTQMAKMLGFSRQSYYNHKNQLTIVSEAAISSYKKAFSLIKAIEDKSPNAFDGIKTVLVGGKSLMAWLVEMETHREDIPKIAQTVHEKIANNVKTDTVTVVEETQTKRLINITRRA